MAGVASQAVDPADQKYIFERCIALMDSEEGKDYGAYYGDELLSIAALVVTPENQRQLEGKIKAAGGEAS